MHYTWGQCKGLHGRRCHVLMVFRLRRARRLERVNGIEPSSSAWKAVALPLSYTRRPQYPPIVRRGPAIAPTLRLQARVRSGRSAPYLIGSLLTGCLSWHNYGLQISRSPFSLLTGKITGNFFFAPTRAVIMNAIAQLGTGSRTSRHDTKSSIPYLVRIPRSQIARRLNSRRLR